MGSSGYMEPITPCPDDRRASAGAYVMNRMLRSEIQRYEEHLKQCPRCAELVAATRAVLPVSVVHQTEDGPVHLWASPNKEGDWRARIWGRQLAGARRFATMGETNRHLLDSFARMFPEHVCTTACMELDRAAQEAAAARMEFWDYSE